MLKRTDIVLGSTEPAPLATIYKHEHIDRKEMAIGTVRKIMLRASKAVLRYGSSAATLGKDR